MQSAALLGNCFLLFGFVQGRQVDAVDLGRVGGTCVDLMQTSAVELETKPQDIVMIPELSYRVFQTLNSNLG